MVHIGCALITGEINAITVPDSYPLPRIDDRVDNVGSACFVTKLDLLKRLLAGTPYYSCHRNFCFSYT